MGAPRRKPKRNRRRGKKQRAAAGRKKEEEEGEAEVEEGSPVDALEAETETPVAMKIELELKQQQQQQPQQTEVEKEQSEQEAVAPTTSMERDDKETAESALETGAKLESEPASEPPNENVDCHESNANANSNSQPTLRDARYAKFFKMLEMGVPRGAVRNALLRDNKDPAVIDAFTFVEPETETETREANSDLNSDSEPAVSASHVSCVESKSTQQQQQQQQEETSSKETTDTNGPLAPLNSTQLVIPSLADNTDDNDSSDSNDATTSTSRRTPNQAQALAMDSTETQHADTRSRLDDDNSKKETDNVLSRAASNGSTATTTVGNPAKKINLPHAAKSLLQDTTIPFDDDDDDDKNKTNYDETTNAKVPKEELVISTTTTTITDSVASNFGNTSSDVASDASSINEALLVIDTHTSEKETNATSAKTAQDSSNNNKTGDQEASTPSPDQQQPQQQQESENDAQQAAKAHLFDNDSNETSRTKEKGIQQEDSSNTKTFNSTATGCDNESSTTHSLSAQNSNNVMLQPAKDTENESSNATCHTTVHDDKQETGSHTFLVKENQTIHSTLDQQVGSSTHVDEHNTEMIKSGVVLSNSPSPCHDEQNENVGNNDLVSTKKEEQEEEDAQKNSDQLLVSSRDPISPGADNVDGAVLVNGSVPPTDRDVCVDSVDNQKSAISNDPSVDNCNVTRDREPSTTSSAGCSKEADEEEPQNNTMDLRTNESSTADKIPQTSSITRPEDVKEENSRTDAVAEVSHREIETCHQEETTRSASLGESKIDSIDFPGNDTTKDNPHKSCDQLVLETNTDSVSIIEDAPSGDRAAPTTTVENSKKTDKDEEKHSGHGGKEPETDSVSKIGDATSGDRAAPMTTLEKAKKTDNDQKKHFEHGVKEAEMNSVSKIENAASGDLAAPIPTTTSENAKKTDKDQKKHSGHGGKEPELDASLTALDEGRGAKEEASNKGIETCNQTVDKTVQIGNTLSLDKDAKQPLEGSETKNTYLEVSNEVVCNDEDAIISSSTPLPCPGRENPDINPVVHESKDAVHNDQEELADLKSTDDNDEKREARKGDSNTGVVVNGTSTQQNENTAPGVRDGHLNCQDEDSHRDDGDDVILSAGTSEMDVEAVALIGDPSGVGSATDGCTQDGPQFESSTQMLPTDDLATKQQNDHAENHHSTAKEIEGADNEGIINASGCDKVVEEIRAPTPTKSTGASVLEKKDTANEAQERAATISAAIEKYFCAVKEVNLPTAEENNREVASASLVKTTTEIESKASVLETEEGSEVEVSRMASKTESRTPVRKRSALVANVSTRADCLQAMAPEQTCAKEERRASVSSLDPDKNVSQQRPPKAEPKPVPKMPTAQNESARQLHTENDLSIGAQGVALKRKTGQLLGRRSTGSQFDATSIANASVETVTIEFFSDGESVVEGRAVSRSGHSFVSEDDMTTDTLPSGISKSCGTEGGAPTSSLVPPSGGHKAVVSPIAPELPVKGFAISRTPRSSMAPSSGRPRFTFRRPRKVNRLAEIIRNDLWSHDPTVVEVALTQLGAVAETEAATIARTGGLLAIVQTMEHHIDHSGIQVAACHALEKLALDHENEVAIMEVGGLEAVISSMMANFEDDRIHEAGWSALWNLTCHNADLTIDIDEGLVALTSCMAQHVQQPGVQRNACGTLANLCQSPERLEALRNAGGFVAIATALETHWDEEDVRHEASHALATLLHPHSETYEDCLFEHSKVKGHVDNPPDPP